MSVIEGSFDVMEEYPLQEKIIIARSHSQGLQWREWIARELGPVSNVTVKTIEDFVYDYGKLELYKANKKLLSEREGYWLIYSFMNSLVKENKHNYKANLLSPGFMDAFHQAIVDLRHAGITAVDMKPEQFEQTDKGILLQQLLTMYETYLSNHQFVDYPGLLPYLFSIQQQSSSLRPIIIVHEHLYPTYIEQKMISTISVVQYLILAGDLPIFHPQSKFPAGQTQFFHSTGILSELKEVLRRMASTEVQHDSVEWIASNYDHYLSAAYSLSKHDDIPFTFSKGLPIQYSTIGKAAYAYLKWLESNFHIEPMLQAIKNQHIKRTKAESDSFSSGKIVYLLEKLGIGWGQDRYALIEKASKNAEKEADKLALQWANTFFQQLFSDLPQKNAYTPKLIVASLIQFLNKYCPPRSEEEAAIINSIQDLQAQMTILNQDETDLETALDYVGHLLQGVRYLVSPMPEPGKVHFSSIDDGGYSGRLYTYIVGMDEENLSVKNRQDPILLDDERERLSKQLPLSHERMNERIQERNSRLGCIRHHCTMSFCSFSSLESEGKHPAFEMLQTFRKQSEIPDVDMEMFLHHLGEPVFFSGTQQQLSCNETDIWLQSLMTETKDVRTGKEIILTYYKPIARGERAISSRQGTEVTVFDGVLKGGLAKEHISSLSFSATQLEQFANCSLQFYFKNILGIRPNEKKEFNRTQWLQAMELGSLIHAIFYQYMIERIESSKISDPHDRERLWKITESIIDEYKEKIPVPSLHVAQKEITDIYRDVDIFIKQEERRKSTPKYMELKIHPEDGYMRVKLSENLEISLRGYVDRIDEIEPHVYRIYDYKTGNPKKYENGKYFAKGTQLQHALYSLAVEQWLRNGDDPYAVVKEAVYYFPTQRGLGKEVVRQQNRKETLAQLIEIMLDAIQKGTFLPTENASICSYCDYKDVCGDHAQWRKDKVVSDGRFQSLNGVKQYD